jgi:hypothetical protein
MKKTGEDKKYTKSNSATKTCAHFGEPIRMAHALRESPSESKIILAA